MKKLLVLTMVLVTCSMANAMLKISVDGVVDVPDTEILIDKSDTVVIDVMSDGQDLSGPALMYIHGPAVYDLSLATNTVNPPGYPDSVLEVEPGMIFMDLAIVLVPIPNLPQGKLVDLISLHCEGPGDVLIELYMDYSVYGGELTLMDTQIIHQIPEPMTIALLGLGGLFLRRRK